MQDATSTKNLRKSASEICHLSSQARFWLDQYVHLGDLADLHLAAKLGLAAVVQDFIVHEDADVNEIRKDNYKEDITPLHLALREGHIEVVGVLLDPAHGAKVDENDIRAAVSHGSNA